MNMLRQNQNGNEHEDKVSYFFGDKKTAIIIYGRRNQPDIRMIFNPEEKTITSLFIQNGKKAGYILPMNETYWPGLPQSQPGFTPDKNINTAYTGQTKLINGHTCHEVKAENDAYSFTLWVSEDINLNMTQVLSYQSVGKGKSTKEADMFSSLGINGLPLELTLTSKTGGADIFVTLANFEDTVNPEIFSTEGHELFEINQ